MSAATISLCAPGDDGSISRTALKFGIPHGENYVMGVTITIEDEAGRTVCEKKIVLSTDLLTPGLSEHERFATVCDRSVVTHPPAIPDIALASSQELESASALRRRPVLTLVPVRDPR
jgi:hypothetical protein